MIRNIGKIYNKFESGTLTIALAVMLFVVFMQVVMRFVFNNSLSWSEEFARYLFVWFSWMGVSAGLKDKEHLRVEILPQTLIRKGYIKPNEMLTILVSLVWLATTLVVTYFGYEVVMKQMSLNVLTPAIRMPIWIAYLSIPVSGAVVGIRLIAEITDSIKVLLGKATRESEEAI